MAINGLKNPNTVIHSWSAQWQDQNGNVVDYGLVYESPQKSADTLARPDNSELQVTALWFPRETVEAMKRAIR